MSNKGNVFVEGLAMRPNGKTVTDLAIAIFGEEMRAVVVNATNEIGNCFTTMARLFAELAEEGLHKFHRSEYLLETLQPSQPALVLLR